MSLHDDLLERREEILAVAARHGARRVRVFGSVVRGEETPASDLDLLVEFEPACVRMTHGVEPLSIVWFGIGENDPRNPYIVP